MCSLRPPLSPHRQPGGTLPGLRGKMEAPACRRAEAPTKGTLSRFRRWKSLPGEGAGYHNRRISVVKVLAEYILSLGKDAYIPGFFCKEYNHFSRPIQYVSLFPASLVSLPGSPPLASSYGYHLSFLCIFCVIPNISLHVISAAERAGRDKIPELHLRVQQIAVISEYIQQK